MSSTSIYTDERIPYFYIILHVPSGKLYAGCKYGKDANPSTFMTQNGYQTSSTQIARLIAADGLSAFKIIQLLTENVCGIDVYLYETKFLRENYISRRENWINGHDNWLSTSFGTQKHKEAIMNMYGVENISQLSDIKDQKAKTCQSNFGVDWPMQSAEVREKSKQTCLEKYGVEVVTQSNIIKEKTRRTNLEKYGVDHFAKTEEGRQQRKERFTGSNNPQAKYPEKFVGRPVSDKSRNKSAISNGKYRYITPHGVFETHYELRKYYDYTGFSKSYLRSIFDNNHQKPTILTLEKFLLFSETGTKTWNEIGFIREVK